MFEMNLSKLGNQRKFILNYSTTKNKKNTLNQSSEMKILPCPQLLRRRFSE